MAARSKKYSSSGSSESSESSESSYDSSITPDMSFKNFGNSYAKFDGVLSIQGDGERKELYITISCILSLFNELDEIHNNPYNKMFKRQGVPFVKELADFLYDVTTPINHGGVSQLVLNKKTGLYYTTGKSICKMLLGRKNLPDDIKKFLLRHIQWHDEYSREVADGFVHLSSVKKNVSGLRKLTISEKKYFKKKLNKSQRNMRRKSQNKSKKNNTWIRVKSDSCHPINKYYWYLWFVHAKLRISFAAHGKQSFNNYIPYLNTYRDDHSLLQGNTSSAAAKTVRQPSCKMIKKVYIVLHGAGFEFTDLTAADLQAIWKISPSLYFGYLGKLFFHDNKTMGRSPVTETIENINKTMKLNQEILFPIVPPNVKIFRFALPGHVLRTAPQTDFILRNRAGYPEEIWRESYQRSRIQLHRLMIEKKYAKDEESSSSDEDVMANDHALKTIAKDVDERLDDGLLPDSPEKTDIISGMGSLSEGYVGAFITEFKHGLNNFNNPIRYFNEGLSNDKTTIKQNYREKQTKSNNQFGASFAIFEKTLIKKNNNKRTPVGFFEFQTPHGTYLTENNVAWSVNKSISIPKNTHDTITIKSVIDQIKEETEKEGGEFHTKFNKIPRDNDVCYEIYVGNCSPWGLHFAGKKARMYKFSESPSSDSDMKLDSVDANDYTPHDVHYVSSQPVNYPSAAAAAPVTSIQQQLFLDSSDEDMGGLGQKRKKRKKKRQTKRPLIKGGRKTRRKNKKK